MAPMGHSPAQGAGWGSLGGCKALEWDCTGSGVLSGASSSGGVAQPWFIPPEGS